MVNTDESIHSVFYWLGAATVNAGSQRMPSSGGKREIRMAASSVPESQVRGWRRCNGKLVIEACPAVLMPAARNHLVLGGFCLLECRPTL